MPSLRALPVNRGSVNVPLMATFADTGPLALLTISGVVKPKSAA